MASSLKKKQQQLRADQDLLADRWIEVLAAEEYKLERPSKSYPKRRLLPQLEEEATKPTSPAYDAPDRPLRGRDREAFRPSNQAAPRRRSKNTRVCGNATDLRDILEDKARQTRSIYGSRGRPTSRDDNRHAGYDKYGQAKYNRQSSSELHRDIAQYRGAAHPLCFTDEVMDHQIPEGFKPVNIESYDGTTDPAVWIEDYLLHIHMARGDDLHAIKYLPLKLKGPARHWLNSLPAESISCWEDLESAFLDNFQGTYVRPPDANDLSHIIQKQEESARQLWTRFLTKKNQIIDCPDAEALAAFRHNIRDEWLARHLGQEKPKSMAALTTLMARFCTGEDSWLARSNNITKSPGNSDTKDNNGRSHRNKHKRRINNDNTEDTAVNAGFRGSKPGQRKKPFKRNPPGPSSLDRILDRSCQIHGTPEQPANHTNRDCWVFKQAGKLSAETREKGLRSDDGEEPWPPNNRGQKGFPPQVRTVNMIYATHIPKRERKRALKDVYALEPVAPKINPWSSCPITFD